MDPTTKPKRIGTLEAEIKRLSNSLESMYGRLEKIEGLPTILDEAREVMIEANELAESLKEIRLETLRQAEEMAAADYALKGSPLDDRILSVEKSMNDLRTSLNQKFAEIEGHINQQAAALLERHSIEISDSLAKIHEYLSVVSASAPGGYTEPASLESGLYEEDITFEEQGERQLVSNLLSEPRFSEPLLLEEFEERLATVEGVWQWLEEQNLVGGLAGRLRRLEDALVSQRELSTLRKMETRIAYAQKHGPGLVDIPLSLSMSAEELCASLRDDHYLLSLATARQIINHLQVRRILVLQGPPGTGKSLLARLLAKNLLTEGQHSLVSEASMGPEVSHFNVIGGLMKYGNMFGPHLGFLSEAVLKSIESGGRHWLFIDEINRGDISAVLSSALDGLNLEVGRLSHDYLYWGNVNPRGTIAIPGAFRIIGTMNTFDEDQLFPFSEALRRRIAFIDINLLPEAEEIILVDELISRMSVGGKLEVVGRVSRELLDVVNRVRLLAQHEPRHIFRYCEVGTKILLDALKCLCLELGSGSGLHSRADIEMTLDKILSDYLFSNLMGRDVELLEVLRDSVFSAPRFKLCRDKLEKRITETQVF